MASMKWAWHFCRCTSDNTIFYRSYKKSDWIKFKGYFCYKMITSQNVPSEAQVENFFDRKVMFHSQDIQVFVFLIIPSFTKSTTSWWILVHEAVHFYVYLLNLNSLSHQTWLTDWYKEGQLFFRNLLNNLKGPGTIFPVFSIGPNTIEMSAMKLTSIGPNFVLIVRRILKK